MAASEIPVAEERRRVGRHKIARRLHEALMARYDPWPEQSDQEIAS
jgi:hypothetical protein